MTSPSSPTSRRRAPAGFTLIELLLASTLGALVLMAAAQAAGMFATQVKVLTDEGNSELEQALATIVHDVRYAWWAEVTGTSTTIVTGPSGQETTYSVDSGRLTVSHNRGGSDELMDGLDSATFAATTMTRYREDDPVSGSDAFWWSSAPATPGAALVLLPGDALGLGFTVRSASPWASAVGGIEEQVLSATIDQLELPIATLVDGGAALQVSVHRARAPGDGRPEGPPLATKVIKLDTLPLLAYGMLNSNTGLAVTVPPSGVLALLAANSTLVIQTVAPANDAPLPLWGSARPIEPGVSYSLVVQVVGGGAVAVRVHPLATAAGSGLCLSSPDNRSAFVLAATGYTPIAAALPRRLRGTVTATSTRAVEVVTRVDIVLRDTSGLTARGSATVSGQALAEHPWLGAIPGESPTMTGAGP